MRSGVYTTFDTAVGRGASPAGTLVVEASFDRVA
jgi:hypothetical protein